MVWIFDQHYLSKWELWSRGSSKRGSKLAECKYLIQKMEYLSWWASLQETIKMWYSTWSAKHWTCVYGKIIKEKHGLPLWWTSEETLWLFLNSPSIVSWREISLISMERCQHSKPENFLIFLSACSGRNTSQNVFKLDSFRHSWKWGQSLMVQLPFSIKKQHNKR